MTFKQSLKNLVSFEKREFDWWVYTLLPIIIFFLNFPFILNSITDFKIICFMFAQLLISYSLILGSSDLFLKFKSKLENKPQIGYSFLLVLISFMLLAISYNYQNKLILNIYWSILYVMASLILTLFALISYNNNPDAQGIFGLDPNKVIKERVETEEKQLKDIESPKTGTKMGVKWGEK